MTPRPAIFAAPIETEWRWAADSRYWGAEGEFLYVTDTSVDDSFEAELRRAYKEA